MKKKILFLLLLLTFPGIFALHEYQNPEQVSDLNQGKYGTGQATTPNSYTPNPKVQSVNSINWVFPSKNNIDFVSDGNITFALDKKNSIITLGLAKDLNLVSSDVNNAQYLQGFPASYFYPYSNPLSFLTSASLPDVNGQFVPYNGAIMDVNLGSKSLATTGVVTGNAIRTPLITDIDGNKGLSTTPALWDLNTGFKATGLRDAIATLSGGILSNATSIGIGTGEPIGSLLLNINSFGVSGAIVQIIDTSVGTSLQFGQTGGTPPLSWIRTLAGTKLGIGISGSTDAITISSRDTVLSGDLNVAKDSNLMGFLTVGNGAGKHIGLVAGDVNVGNNLYVQGDANFNNLQIKGVQFDSGNAKISGDLNVAKDTNIMGFLTVGAKVGKGNGLKAGDINVSNRIYDYNALVITAEEATNENPNSVGVIIRPPSSPTNYVNLYARTDGRATLSFSGAILYIQNASTPITYFDSTGISSYTGKNINIGSTTATTSIIKSTTGTYNNPMIIGLADSATAPTGARNLLITDFTDADFNYGHASSTNPTVFIHSANQNRNQWLSLSNNATDSNISSGIGGVLLQPYSMIGSATNTGMAAGDLNASGKIIGKNGISSKMGYDINGTAGQTKTFYINGTTCWIDINAGIITASGC